MPGGGEYSWIRTDTGYAWSGPGPAPGCGPGCCGGCRYTPPKAITHSIYQKALDPDILINYVTKKELQEALDNLRGVCGMSVDKENSARCNLPKGHKDFCYRVREDDR